MEPIQVVAYRHVTGPNVDEHEIQHRLELRFAQSQQRHQLLQWLNSRRPGRPAAVALVPGVAE